MIKAIVFDCFGVLYNDAYHDFLDRHAARLEESPEYYYRMAVAADLGTISEEEFYGELSKLTGIEREQIKAEMTDTRKVNRRLVELIKQLKRDYTIGMLSNASSGYLHGFLVAHDLEPLFDHVVASSDAGYVKPQPEIFKLTAKRIGALPSEMIFIDDNADNVAAAGELGIAAIHYTHTSRLLDDLKEHVSI